MKHHPIGKSAMAGLIAVSQTAAAAVVTFEEITLPPSGYLNQSFPAGGFTVHGTTFRNDYNATFDSWSGFAVSKQTDNTTAGYLNQYSAFTGGGAAGSANYAIGYWSTYDDAAHITFAGLTNLAGKGASFTNTTYAALSMRDGDMFAKKFGGASGNDADWLKLTLSAFVGGSPTGAFIDFYLADFRFADNSQDYIIDEWTAVDFSPLGSADQIRFSMSSSDNGAFGMNTPSFFAIDNVAVPEPSAMACSLAGLAIVLRRRRPIDRP